MTIPAVSVDDGWGKLADQPEADREPQMLQRYRELGELPEPDCQRRLLAMAQAEYALPADKLKSFTLSRIRVFLTLPPVTGKRIAQSYNAVMHQMPGAAAMRRVALVQTLAKEFSDADQARLRELNPDVFGDVPSGMSPGQAPQVPSASATSAPTMMEKKKGWWPFGKK